MGCVVYLVRNTAADIANLVHSLTLLRENYLAKFPCTVFAYHESLIDGDAKEIQRLSGVTVEFRQIAFHVTVAGLTGRLLGYRHMCHFFVNDVFYLPELVGFEYYMRLDTDSYIMSAIPYDLFERMQREKWNYGYIAVAQDNPRYTCGLWSAAFSYLQQHPEIHPECDPHAIPDGKCYYTNFEICQIPWFKRDPNASFFAYLDKLNGIYTTRWGDHTIRYLSVNLFMNHVHVHQFCDLHYHHQREYKGGRKV